MDRLWPAMVNQAHNGSNHIPSLQLSPNTLKGEVTCSMCAFKYTAAHRTKGTPSWPQRTHEVKATQLLGSQESLEARPTRLCWKSCVGSHTTTLQDKWNMSPHTSMKRPRKEEKSTLETAPSPGSYKWNKGRILLLMKARIWPTNQKELMFLKGSTLIPSSGRERQVWTYDHLIYYSRSRATLRHFQTSTDEGYDAEEEPLKETPQETLQGRGGRPKQGCQKSVRLCYLSKWC